MWWLPLVPLGVLTERGSRGRWLLVPGVVTVTAVASSVVKLVVRRPRPGAPRVRAPLGRLDAAGFPSTHSACAFAIAAWLRRSRQGPKLHLVAVLIGCSRVCRRAHHPADVVAGAILGYGIVWRAERLRPKSRRFHDSLPVAPPVPARRRGRERTGVRDARKMTVGVG
jgi:membrane-associated phospholipid phosphatase